MKKICFTLFTAILIQLSVAGQTTRQWTDADKNYLLDHLIRSRDELLKATNNLSRQQWNFKESPDRWSINQVVEHLNIFELLFQRETTMAISSGTRPELATTSKPDSVYVSFIMEDKHHNTIEYTKPFTYTVPLGLNEGNNNLALFTKMRNESIDFIKTATGDLRLYSLKPGRPNLHQLYIYVFGHVDRHLRQINKIKQHPNYPK